jgi:hypothetical protein
MDKSINLKKGGCALDKIKFSVDKIDFIEDSRNNQFGVFKLYAFASGDNAHGLPVSVSTLKKTAYTIYNKPIVWKYEWFSDDAGGHEEDEVPCGFVYKENNPIKFTKLKDGRVMLVVNALVWKKYSGRLMEIFARDDAEKSVSVEIEVYETKDLKDGKTELMDFVYTAITILGEKINPAIPMARAEVLQFSKEKEEYEKVYKEYFEDKYENINFKIPKNVKDNVKSGFELKKEYNINVSSKILSIARFLQNNDKITSDKVIKFLSYIPKFNFSEISESKPPSNTYIKMMLCGGENGVNWMNGLNADMQKENEKVVGYFGSNSANDFESTNVDEKILDTEIPNIGKEDIAEHMDNFNFSNQTYGELRDKMDAFLSDFKDKDGYCKFYVVDFLVDEPMVIVRDMEDGKYLKVRYENGEDGLSVYLEDAEEVKTAWVTDFSNESNEENTDSEKNDFSEELDSNFEEEKEEEEEEEEEEEDEEKEEDMSEGFEENRQNEISGEDVATIEGEKLNQDVDLNVLYSEIESLKNEVNELKEYKTNVETEKKNFEIEKTINEVVAKCPNIPSSEIEMFRESAKEFSLDNLDTWKNALKAKAWAFTAGESSKGDVVKIALEYTNAKEQSSKKLWV